MNEVPLFSVENKSVFITGASRGIGKALAIGFAKAGAKVICASSKAGGTAQTLAEIESFGGQAFAVHADLANTEEVETMLGAILAEHKTIDVLINNGGTISRFPAAEYPLHEFKKVIDVNVNSAFLISQILGKKMIEQGHGKIINIASMLSYSGGLTVPAYTASKHAIAGLTKALANEWAKLNVQVNAIAPGYFATDNTQALRDNPERNQSIKNRIPAGKWGEAEQLVGAAIFLASPSSQYVNGHILAVDGGWLAS
ncbi:SDR family oxidoreductase [Paraglaciecola aquimarina]|uniref:SDR family oxidoreductase n=1 Tax=Paraglaciecola aquimarina TaxID=1235557 RepID=A0ABU3STB9_9ALTE|nr:SDR family NAD(P)-dependent oxidoreductase [Paraglaciecola aquimarina]MDU0353264.1 SDR family oxidoreductase [Paraglaciecola aquimarina]